MEFIRKSKETAYKRHVEFPFVIMPRAPIVVNGMKKRSVGANYTNPWCFGEKRLGNGFNDTSNGVSIPGESTERDSFHIYVRVGREGD